MLTMPSGGSWTQGEPIRYETVAAILEGNQCIPQVTRVEIDAIDLNLYDTLLENVEVN